MIQVLIAEDELLTRMGLTSLVPWEDMGFHIVDSVSDGEQAWISFQKYHPDVLITDIKMHKMDGLALIKKVQEIDESCRIIVVTCLDDFGEQINSLGIKLTGIVQKAVLTRDDLCALLIDIKKDLETTKKSVRSSIFDYSLIQSQLHSIFFDNNTSLELSKEFNRYLSTHNYVLGLYCGYIQDKLLISVAEMLKEKLTHLGTVFFSHENENIVFVIASSTIIPVDIISDITSKFSVYINNMFDLHLRYVFSCINDICGLPKQAQSISTILNNPYFYPDTFIIQNDSYDIVDSFKPMISSLKQNPVLYGFFEGNVHDDFDNLINELESYIGVNISAFISTCEHLVQFVIRFCFSSNTKTSLKRFNISQYHDAPKLLGALIEMLPSYNPNPVYISKMLESINYIHNNYGMPLSVAYLAEKMSVSSNYYAILFKKITSTNFSDFLTGIRLYHAEQLLSHSTFSVMIIAQKCGFSDSTYFTKVFRETHQMTPRQYRNSSQKEGIRL